MTKLRTFKSIDDTKSALSQQQYISNDEIATTTFLAQQWQKPLLTEGPAGVGKTEVAKAIAAATGRALLRRRRVTVRASHGIAPETTRGGEGLTVRVRPALGRPGPGSPTPTGQRRRAPRTRSRW